MSTDSNTTETQFSVWLTQMSRAMGYPTDASLAEALEISPSTILRWRRGSKPSITHLVSLSEVLGVQLVGLLALTGHADPDILGSRAKLPEPPSPITETVRRIRSSALSDHVRGALARYWDGRLAEERHRVYELIRVLEGAERGEIDVIDDLLKVLSLASQPGLPKHLVTLLREVTSIFESGGSRRRAKRPLFSRLQFTVRSTESGRYRLEMQSSEGSMLNSLEEFETSQEAVEQLERMLGFEPEGVQIDESSAPSE
ncbi:helix-turn-helix domain-containing protein [Nonomuraea spiralis]|uniref:Helix-turn-helix domain-containing protein n=1 Tax=Nonomuraea spiralis TaxID=46182 RepID=A0ABV5IPP3_9ACTN|nr:helix-turn-helix transcriptional regulator [Nonomuraea spiralis]GGT38553.1 hypothetical protein GCM10010176_098250 [Nonomuraea spiralis]